MSQTHQNLLIALPGPNDPYRPGLLEGEELVGPILAAAQARRFTNVLLVGSDEAALRATEEPLRAHCHELSVSSSPLEQSASLLSGTPAGTSVAVCADPEEKDYEELVALLDRAGIPAYRIIAEAPVIPTSSPLRVRMAPIKPRYPEPSKDKKEVREPETAHLYGEEEISAVPARVEPKQSASELLPAVADQLGIRGSDPKLTSAMDTAAAIAEHNVPVLIQGETGTGKGLFAELVHLLSPRARHTFVSVNCAALPEKLVESILFGHKKGAFTGATSDQLGKFQQADGGTLFLDEIGELPLDLQPKLLRILEDGMVEPLGGSKPRKVDVRIIAATNVNLAAAVQEGLFREDLFYRLSFAVLALPPLRERPGDVEAIALQLVERMNLSLRNPKRLTKEALKRLSKHTWKGNVRDLENVIGRSMLLCQKEVLDAEDLLIQSGEPADEPLAGLPVPHEHFVLEEFLADARSHLIQRALDLADGNQSAAARLLGMTQQAINKFVKANL